MKIDEINKKIEIHIYKITTGKCTYFTFWESKSKRLELGTEPFKIKLGTSEYPYKHHMSDDDILIWQKYSDNIVPFSSRYNATSWENTMKYEIFKVIESGKLNKKVEILDETYDLTYHWIGEEVPRAEIQYK